MDKHEAIRLLGGTPTAAAKAIGISTSAVCLWPDVLPPRIVDRVQAALWRMSQAAGTGDDTAAMQAAISSGANVDLPAKAA